MFVLGALERFQRYQALEITSKVHWNVVTVANGQSAIISGLSDVFYPGPVSVSTS